MQIDRITALVLILFIAGKMMNPRLCYASKVLQRNKIRHIVAFGDSWVDTGLPYGLWAYDNKTYPLRSLMYNKGRNTNKLLWIEYVARELKAKLTSFGIGGLTVNNETNGDPTFVGAGRAMLSNTLGTYKSFASRLKAGGKSLPDTAIFSAGGNDLFYVNTTWNLTAQFAFLGNVPRGIGLMADAVLKRRFKTVVINYVNDPFLNPYGRKHNISEAAFAAVTAINQGIESEAAKLRQKYPKAKILTLDFNKEVQEYISHPSKYGLINTTATCLVTDTGYTLRPANFISVCPDTTKFLFWDNYHFTDAGMRLYADFTLRTLRKVLA